MYAGVKGSCIEDRGLVTWLDQVTRSTFRKIRLGVLVGYLALSEERWLKGRKRKIRKHRNGWEAPEEITERSGDQDWL